MTVFIGYRAEKNMTRKIQIYFFCSVMEGFVIFITLYIYFFR